MVHEIIRWQTPLAYMRRVATQDTVLNGQFIRKGDKVVMWYASANRDERTFENPDDFVIDRRNARHHLSFGIGVAPLHGQPAGRDAAANPVGGAAGPVRRHRGCGRARVCAVELRPRLQHDDGGPHADRW